MVAVEIKLPATENNLACELSRGDTVVADGYPQKFKLQRRGCYRYEDVLKERILFCASMTEGRIVDVESQGKTK